MIDVVIVDDQDIVREGLKMILSLHEEIHIAGEAANGEELFKLLETVSPNCGFDGYPHAGDGWDRSDKTA